MTFRSRSLPRPGAWGAILTLAGVAGAVAAGGCGLVFDYSGYRAGGSGTGGAKPDGDAGDGGPACPVAQTGTGGGGGQGASCGAPYGAKGFSGPLPLQGLGVSVSACGAVTVVGQEGASSVSAFALHANLDSTEAWRRTFEGSGGRFTAVAAVGSAGTVAVGTSAGRATLACSNTTIGNGSDTDAVVVRFDERGIPMWTQSFGGAAVATGVAVDGHDEKSRGVVVVGTYAGGLAGDVSAMTGMFVARYSDDGKLSWRTRLTSTAANGAPKPIGVAAQGGLVVVAGTYTGSLAEASDLPPTPQGKRGTFVVTLGDKGAIQQKYAINGAEANDAAFTAMAISSEKDTHVVLAGPIVGSLTDSKGASYTHSGREVTFVQLDQGLTPLSVPSLGPTKDNTVESLAVDSDGNIFVAGVYQTPISANVPTPTGTYNAYVMRSSPGQIYFKAIETPGATIPPPVGLALLEDAPTPQGTTTSQLVVVTSGAEVKLGTAFDQASNNEQIAVLNFSLGLTLVQ